MISTSETLHKSGVLRAYQEEEQELQGIRGKILFGNSLKQNHFMHGRAICLADDFTLDGLPNQILKATLNTLLRADDLHPNYEDDLHHFVLKLDGVKNININRSLFSKVQINSKNRIYRFLMSLCELIYDCWLPDTQVRGKYLMKNLIQDEVKMRRIFQNFVRNFYAQEQTIFPRVTAEYLQWDAVAITDGGLEFLPRMETDISLISDNRTFIIDTKYYIQALARNRYGKEIIHSEHLYQLTNYLDHKARGLSHRPEGMLLYPTVGTDIRLTYTIKGHRLSICTVDLSKPWDEIHNELLGLIQ